MAGMHGLSVRRFLAMRTSNRNGLLFLLLCFGLVVAVMAMAAPQGTYNSSTDGFAVTLANPPNAIATSEVVVPGDQVVALPWYNTTTNAISNNLDDCDAIIAICPDDANSTGNMFADIIWSAGPAPPLDVGSSAHVLKPTNATGAGNANIYSMTMGTDSEARAIVTSSKNEEDGTHRFTAART